jgi:hypothetical protein
MYDDVFLEGNKLLNEPYGKTSCLTYYYIGRSLCGKGYVNQGKDWYHYIKEKLQIDDDFRSKLSSAESNCVINTSPNTTTVVNVIVNNSYTPNQPGGIRGKGGFTLGCQKDVNENYANLRKNDSLGDRVFSRDEKLMAIKKLRTFLSDKYVIDTSGRFIVISLAEASYYHNDVITVTNKLEFAYQYYVTKYRLHVPDKLFTVYLLPDRYNLRTAAKDVHDIKISEANIGYSSLNDLSLLGIAKPAAVGTLFHELFHLVIRSDVGDISPWLDEGMACLYSVYNTNGNELQGDYNTWRVTHFRLLMDLKPNERVTVPSLQQLINLNWQEYQGGTENNLCIASVNYALSNFFTLYLQANNLLPTVVDLFKNRFNYSVDSFSTGPTDAKLLEKAFNKPIDSIAFNFYKWLKTEYNIDMLSLLKQRPSYFHSDLPDDFLDNLDSVNYLISQMENSGKPKKIVSDLKQEQKTLFNSVASMQSDYLNYQKYQLDEMAGTDMSKYGSDNSEKTYKSRMDAKHIEISNFIDKLKRLMTTDR